MNLSVVVPLYNEEENVTLLYNKIKEALKSVKYEIVFVDDGSTDATLDTLKKVSKGNKNVKIITFSKNFGKDAAMYAGIEYAEGKYTAIIDGDMQQNPKYLVKMYDFLEHNPDYDQVCMIPNKRKDISLFKIIGSKLFYKVINIFSTTSFRIDASDFRMFTTDVKEKVLSLKEESSFLKGSFNQPIFNIKYLPYDVEKRQYGESKFNLRKSIGYAILGITNYADKILYGYLYAGILLLCFGLLVFFTNEYKIILIISLITGIILLIIGFISVCLVRLNLRKQKKITYTIKNVFTNKK